MQQVLKQHKYENYNWLVQYNNSYIIILYGLKVEHQQYFYKIWQ